MELRHLRTFVAVADHRSFSGAARALHVAQPAVSRTIRDLEDELELQLFDRDKRSVRLTAAGNAFYGDAGVLLDRVATAVDHARQVNRGQRGRLRIGFMGSAAGPFLPEVLKPFRRAFPEVNVELFEMTPRLQREALVEERIDLGFTRPLGDEGRALGLAEQPYLVDTVLLALPTGHPAVVSACLDLSTLREEPFVLLERPAAPALHDLLVGMCREAGFSPKIVANPDLMPALLTMVASEIGLALIPGCVANLAHEGVLFRRLKPEPPPVHVHLAWRAREDHPVRDQFIQHVNTLQPQVERLMQRREEDCCALGCK